MRSPTVSRFATAFALLALAACAGGSGAANAGNDHDANDAGGTASPSGGGGTGGSTDSGDASSVGTTKSDAGDHASDAGGSGHGENDAGNSSAPTTDAGGTSSSDGGAVTGGAAWKPTVNTTFYWDLTNAGTAINNSVNVGAYDIDGWNNDATEVSLLHSQGQKVVCYMDVGTYEPGRPDSSDFPASLLGAGVQGWPGEQWLDIRPSGPNYATLQSIMLARFKVCQSKGFDAVEPDNMDSYENDAGFNATAADQLAYDEWVATTVHSLGLAVFQKNDNDQVTDLEPYFDGMLDEECNYYGECNTLAPYSSAGKPAWNAEYTSDNETTSAFCSADVSAGIVGALFDLDLDGKTFEPCTDDVGKIN